MAVLLVTVAGAAGVLARYGIGQLSPGMWATFAINVAGSFALGLIVHLGRDWSSEARDAVGIGFLGGFTTFSTFTVQAVLEADGGETGVAALYVGASVAAGLLAATAGYVAGRALSA
jgi:CrcB protein